MPLLVLTSIVGLTFIIERGLALRRGKVVPRRIEEALDQCHRREDLGRLREVCQARPSALGRIVLTAIEHLPWPKLDNADSVQTKARQEMVGLERGLVVLEIVVGIAPLLGLVGTIHGLITLFGDLSRAGLGDPGVLAKGIAIALNTTLSGLLIAIPTMVAWSYFNNKVESMAVEMETLLDDFLRRHYRRRTKAERDGGREATAE
ncbi:MAG: MotA/TolQ/ExbB proton channel family protein [Verrucomicrobia bacterium]|nr:MotA/TolQ/ExbB proton channel family protein [Verrucomicrobiota bacterium]